MAKVTDLCICMAVLMTFLIFRRVSCCWLLLEMLPGCCFITRRFTCVLLAVLPAAVTDLAGAISCRLVAAGSCRLLLLLAPAAEAACKSHQPARAISSEAAGDRHQMLAERGAARELSCTHARPRSPPDICRCWARPSARAELSTARP